MFLKYLLLFAISMVPVVELRGAIPVGVGMGLDLVPTYLVSVVGNMLPVPFILMLIPWVLAFMEKHRIFPKFVGWLRRRGENGAQKIRDKEAEAEKKAEAADNAPKTGDSTEGVTEKPKKRHFPWVTCCALFAFVAVPLPGTGAWTGALVASFFGMKKRYAIPTIFAGVLVAGLIMSLASFGVLKGVEWLTGTSASALIRLVL